jgi:DNA-binding transcriptional ArsR family regulator
MYRIDEERQFVALKSPVRQEIVDAIVAGGPETITEIAAQLGRPADGLYYHVRQLLSVGLLVEKGRRRAGKRFETIFDLPSREMRVLYPLGDEKRMEPLADAVTAMLRLSDRDFRAGAKLPNTVADGDDRNFWAGRSKAWLTKKQTRQVREHVEAILEITRKASRTRQASLHAFTWLLTPLDPNMRPEAEKEKKS